MTKTNALTKAVIDFLNCSGFKAWRINNGAVYSVKQQAFLKNPQKLNGLPDIQGFRKKDGKAVFIEIKTGKDKLSPQQILFLEEAQRAGCIAVCTRSIDEIMRYISELEPLERHPQDESKRYF